MDHVVYVDWKEKELDLLVSGEKTMILRGAAGRKMPYGRVNSGDQLYLLPNNGIGEVRAKAVVADVIESEKLTPDESKAMLARYMPQLKLSSRQLQRWGGKRYLVLITVTNVEEIPPFMIDKSSYGNMDDWLPVEDIGSVMISS